MAKDKKREKPKTSKQLQQEAIAAKNERNQKLTKNTAMGVAAAIFVFIVVAVVFSERPERPEPGYISNSADLQLESQPSLGDPEALLKVVEFGDFQCGHCKDFHDNVFPDFKENYIDTGKAEFFFITFPVTGLAGEAAGNVASCMYQDSIEGFWQLHDIMFEFSEQMSQLVGGQEVVQNIIKDNVTASYDEEAVFSCISEGGGREYIEGNKNIAKDARISSTPTLLVNRKIANSGGDTFFSALDDRLSELE
jgi:protein-disulfide isomerase